VKELLLTESKGEKKKKKRATFPLQTEKKGNAPPDPNAKKGKEREDHILSQIEPVDLNKKKGYWEQIHSPGNRIHHRL